LRKIQERYLDELFWPSEQAVTQRIRDQFFAEAHNRIAQPLYCIAFALIALAAVTRGRRQRGSVAMRLTGASLVAAGLRVAGYGVMGMAQRNPPLVALFYLLPALGAAGAIAVLAGYAPALLTRPPRSVPRMSCPGPLSLSGGAVLIGVAVVYAIFLMWPSPSISSIC
jgi:lipopolysaccharide export system permease protein